MSRKQRSRVPVGGRLPRTAESPMLSDVGKVSVSGNRVTCYSCTRGGHTQWGDCSPDDLALLNRVRVGHTYEAGQHVFYQGNPCMGIYCLSSGTVAIERTDGSGNRMIVRLATGGQTLGYRAFFANEVYSASARALTRTQTCFIDRREFRKLLSRNLAIGFGFLGQLACDLSESEGASLAGARDAGMSETRSFAVGASGFLRRYRRYRRADHRLTPVASRHRSDARYAARNGHARYS